jgi:putative membrane protein
MPSAMNAWSLPVPITLVLLATACAYVQGWVHLWRDLRNATYAWRLACFVGGLFALWIAIASPLSVLDHQSLIVHMVQHLLLMTVAAPLILLGAPSATLMHGLPQPIVRDGLGPLLRWAPLQWLGREVTHPAFCWLAATAAVMGWHIPALFELCLQSGWWHEVEYASFFLAGLLFWWPVVQPWHAGRQPQWTVPLYLFLATLPCDALSAFLTFCDRVVYPSHFSAHRPFGMSALPDQQWAGALMWVWVTIAYLVPAVALTIQILSPRELARMERTEQGRAVEPARQSISFRVR